MCTSSWAWQKPATYIWKTGPLHANEVIGKTGEQWFGLFGRDLNYELRQTKVTVSDSETTGGLYDRFVSVDQKTQPLLLIKGMPGLSNRKVHSVLSTPTFVFPAESKSFKFDDHTYYDFTSFGEAVDETVDVVINNYELRLRSGRRSQVVASFARIGSDKHPMIFWAGDLDGDGKLDFIMDTAAHYNVVEYTLFLSSAAEAGKLVKKVASFRRAGC